MVPLAGFILVLLGRFAACAGRFNGDHCVCHGIATDATGLGVLLFIRKFSNSTLCLGCFVEKDLTVGVVGLLILGVLAAGIFVVRQLNRQLPMLQMRVFATGMFTKAVFLTGISYVG